MSRKHCYRLRRSNKRTCKVRIDTNAQICLHEVRVALIKEHGIDGAARIAWCLRAWCDVDKRAILSGNDSKLRRCGVVANGLRRSDLGDVGVVTRNHIVFCKRISWEHEERITGKIRLIQCIDRDLVACNDMHALWSYGFIVGCGVIETLAIVADAAQFLIAIVHTRCIEFTNVSNGKILCARLTTCIAVGYCSCCWTFSANVDVQLMLSLRQWVGRECCFTIMPVRQKRKPEITSLTIGPPLCCATRYNEQQTPKCCDDPAVIHNVMLSTVNPDASHMSILRVPVGRTCSSANPPAS